MTEERMDEIANDVGEKVARETKNEKEFLDALDGVITLLQDYANAARENIGEEE